MATSLLVATILLPLAGTLAVFVGGHFSAGIFRGFLVACFGISLAVSCIVLSGAGPLTTHIGGWMPPLGITLHVDRFAAVLLALAAVVMTGVGWFAAAQVGPDSARADSFRIFFLATWSALAATFTLDDLFSLYVALELLTLAAVPLVSLGGTRATLEAALRYLLFALLGSMFYLAGVGLVYGMFGTLSVPDLARVVPGNGAAVPVVGLMIAGLLAKGAVFPFHFWLPPAHAGAPAPASAILSAMVVKVPFFLILRLWFEVLGGQGPEIFATAVGGLGAAAILFGSVMAFRQDQIKLLIAYSTVAQIGYLFLVFPLAGNEPAAQHAMITAGTLQLASHALAKTALFLAAGLLIAAAGGGRIRDLAGLGRHFPVLALAVLASSLSLIGLPPSGGFRAKWMLLERAMLAGEWWWALVILTGGILAAGYLSLLLGPLLTGVRKDSPIPQPHGPQWLALGFSLASLFLGLTAVWPVNFLWQ